MNFFVLILVAYVGTAEKKPQENGHIGNWSSLDTNSFWQFSSSWASFYLVFSQRLLPVAAGSLVIPFSGNHIRLLKLAAAKVGWDDCPSSVSRAKQRNVFCRKKLLQRSPVVLLGDLQVLSLEVTCSRYTQTCILLCKQV